MTLDKIEALKAELEKARETIERFSKLEAFVRFACTCGYTWLERAPVTADTLKLCVRCKEP